MRRTPHVRTTRQKLPTLAELEERYRHTFREADAGSEDLERLIFLAIIDPTQNRLGRQGTSTWLDWRQARVSRDARGMFELLDMLRQYQPHPMDTVGFHAQLKTPFTDGHGDQCWAGLTPLGMGGWNGCPDYKEGAPTLPLAVVKAALSIHFDDPGPTSGQLRRNRAEDVQGVLDWTS